MKKNLIKFLFICLLIITLSSCDYFTGNNQGSTDKQESSIKINTLPSRQWFYIDEEVDFTGLVVKLYYDDNSSIVVNDYELIHDDLVEGDNLITVKYKDFYTSFNIKIYEREVVKKTLDEYPNYQELTTKTIDYQSFDYQLNDVYYGVYRNTDMMIIYDEVGFVHTNIYGYEAAIDKYGMVVEVAKNVHLPDEGMIISAHGKRKTEIMDLEVGDFIVYLNNTAYIYKEEKVSKANGLFLEFYKLIEELENTKDLLIYNQKVDDLNNLIPYLNNLYNEYNDEDYNKAKELIDELSYDIYDHNHQYSYTDKIYDEYLLETRVFDYRLQFIYEEEIHIGGFRSSNQLHYYDASCYRDRNMNGYEISVNSEGIVLDKDVLVSLEQDGFILSGSGDIFTFMYDNIEIGDQIKIIDGKTYIYKDVINLYYQKYGKLRNKLVTIINDEIEKGIPHDYEYIDEIIKQIDAYLDLFNKDNLNLSKYIDIIKGKTLASELIALGYSQLIEYEAEETRGISYSPFTQPLIYDDTTIEGIRKTLNTFKEMGINEVSVYTFYQNYSLFENSIYYRHEEIAKYNYGEYGNDYLKCFIEEAHKLNIAVSAFTQNFREYIQTMKNPKEEYYQIDYQGNKSKGSIYYYDICNDELQDIIITWYKELLTQYDFDKIEYDIIRYPISYLYKYETVNEIPTTTTISDHGYTEYAINKFMELNNLTGDLKELIRTSRDIRNKWQAFKEASLINFITKCSTELRNIDSDIIITAAVLGDSELADIAYLQDYRYWLELGIIDIAEVMMYTISNSYLGELILDVQDIINDYGTIMYISPRLEALDIIVDFQQIRLASMRNGYYLFSSSLYNDKVFEKILKSNHHGMLVSIYNSDEEIKTATINEVIDMIKYYYSVKNNEDYSSLIKSLESSGDYLDLINNLNDELMKTYLLNKLKK